MSSGRLLLEGERQSRGQARPHLEGLCWSRESPQRRAGAGVPWERVSVSDQPDATYSIRSVQRVCDILDLLKSSDDGVSLADVAAATGLPKSSAFRYLVTLESCHYVERDVAAGTFRLGLAFLPMQIRQADLLARLARPHLERLRDELGETVNLGVLEGHHVIYLEIAESEMAMRMAARQGDRDLIHSTALGKAIAATLPEERVRAILAAEGMSAVTPATITDPDLYMEELARVRAQDYALDDAENEPDGRCVAVSLGGRFEAAISISAPSSRLTVRRTEEAVRALQQVVVSLVGAASRHSQI